MAESTVTEDDLLKFDEWRINFEDRTRNRMKLTIKLGADQAKSFNNFFDVACPDGISKDDFVRSIFFNGWSYMQHQLNEAVKEYAAANKEELAASGITVIEGAEGITLSSTEEADTPEFGEDHLD